jgi:hypothetical protein
VGRARLHLERELARLDMYIPSCGFAIRYMTRLEAIYVPAAERMDLETIVAEHRDAD